ncbi:hypothetical protein ACH9L7_10440 [Haloferax sp. S1W]|uniref:hypothetical protein n=1 Tax=Haloferax sp. S1W TaxID=3377110 RepID=UPI0037C728D2
MRTIDMGRVDSSVLGVALVVIGVVALVTLRFWASPIVGQLIGRERVSVVAFLGIPLFLLLVGAGIVLFIWGPDSTAE